MRIVVLLASIALCGCSQKHIKPPGTLNYTVGGECHVTLRELNCDSSSPPHCQHILAEYDKHCERLLVRK